MHRVDRDDVGQVEETLDMNEVSWFSPSENRGTSIFTKVDRNIALEEEKTRRTAREARGFESPEVKYVGSIISAVLPFHLVSFDTGLVAGTLMTTGCRPLLVLEIKMASLIHGLGESEDFVARPLGY